jgi:hypothetical protein
MKPDHNSGMAVLQNTSPFVDDMHLLALVSCMLKSYDKIKRVPQAFLTVGGEAATDISVPWISDEPA